MGANVPQDEEGRFPASASMHLDEAKVSDPQPFNEMFCPLLHLAKGRQWAGDEGELRCLDGAAQNDS